MLERPIFTQESLAKLRSQWKVQWRSPEDGRLLFKQFHGERPTKAVEFGKQLKRRGISVVDIISMSRAFPPPLKKLIPDRRGLMWCPYCIKWREFEERGLGTSPLLIYMRCSGCGISVKDAYVRKYNPELVMRYEIEHEMRAQAKATQKKKGGKRDVRGAIRRR